MDLRAQLSCIVSCPLVLLSVLTLILLHALMQVSDKHSHCSSKTIAPTIAVACICPEKDRCPDTDVCVIYWWHRSLTFILALFLPRIQPVCLEYRKEISKMSKILTLCVGQLLSCHWTQYLIAITWRRGSLFPFMISVHGWLTETGWLRDMVEGKVFSIWQPGNRQQRNLSLLTGLHLRTPITF